MSEYESVVRDGMRIDWDVPIEMDDGIALRADVFRPIAEGRYPVIMTAGPYGKWLHFDAFAVQYARLTAEHPEVLSDSSNRYQVYEMCDPEKFVPEGYVVVRIDTRGAGRSPGFLDIWSLREAQDYAICIEWAARQAWSSGRIGLSGIS
jgi:uncharacterized protein